MFTLQTDLTPSHPSSNVIQISGNTVDILQTWLLCRPKACGAALVLKCNWETATVHPNACAHLITSGARNPE